MSERLFPLRGNIKPDNKKKKNKQKRKLVQTGERGSPSGGHVERIRNFMPGY